MLLREIPYTEDLLAACHYSEAHRRVQERAISRTRTTSPQERAQRAAEGKADRRKAVAICATCPLTKCEYRLTEKGGMTG